MTCYIIEVVGVGFIHKARGWSNRWGYRYSIGGLDAWLISTREQADQWVEIVRKNLANDALFKGYEVRVREVRIQ